jgi:hypothetical protein
MSAVPAFTVAHALDAYLAQAAAKPFSWSQHNCCHFVAGWVQQATGLDPMAGLPWTHSATAARRLILQLGGTLADAWTRRLGRHAIQPELAQVGDIVHVWLREQDCAAVGICTGRHAALLLEDEGVILLPMAHATHCWRLRADDDAGAEAAPC